MTEENTKKTRSEETKKEEKKTNFFKAAWDKTKEASKDFAKGVKQVNKNAMEKLHEKSLEHDQKVIERKQAKLEKEKNKK